MKLKNVSIGKNANIGRYVELGLYPKNLKTKIGNNAVIRSHTIIYAGNKIGNDFKTGHAVLIREKNVIGDNVSVGSHTIIERENEIGNNVRIHSNCFIPEFVKIEDDVWISPSTTILNVLHPPCPRFEDCATSVVIEKNAKIGGNVTIGPRVRIGKNSFIGMGSVVTNDVPANSVAYGVPAKVIKKKSELKCIMDYFKRPYEWEGKWKK